MIAFGYLIAETTAPLRNKRTFMGIEAHTRTPIELAAIAFIGAATEHTLLIVDSFQAMTGANERYVSDGKAALKVQLELLQTAFDFEVVVKETSSFMTTPTYSAIYSDVERQVRGSKLEEELRRSTPDGDSDIIFALHEVATTRYMQREHGIEVKVGQRREKLYDTVIAEATGMDFAYTFPFFAFVTGKEVKTPYNPESGAKEGGKRIMLGDAPEKIAETIRRGPLDAQIAMTRLGFAAAALKNVPITLTEKYPQPENCLNAIGLLVEQYEIAKLRRRLAKSRYIG